MATDVARLAMEFTTSGAKRAQSDMDALRSGSVRLTRATEEQIAAQTRLTSSFNRQSAPAVGRFGQRLRALTQSFKLQKGATQQAGFQIQDFTTQIAAGQSATVAFGQQASQLAGILGPGGVVLGAFVAIGAAITGVFINSMGGASESTETLTEKTRELVKELGRATARQREFINTGFQQEILEQERQVRRAKDTIVEMNARLDDFRRAAGENVPDAVFDSNSAVKSLRDEIDRARLTIDNAESSTQAIAKAQKEFWEEVEETGEKTKDTTDKIREMVQAAEQQAATIGLSARATATYEAALAGANAEQILAIDQAYQRIEAEQAKQDALKESERREIATRKALMASTKITVGQDPLLQRMEAQRRGMQMIAEESQFWTDRMAENQQQISQSMLGTMGSVFSSLETFTEKGTAEWAAMVLAQKGIMAAQAIMAANLAATLALASPLVGTAPAAVAAQAETIRQIGYVNAGLILATGVGEVAASFDGGGYTGDGPRTRGLDGKGGFLAMMHPQETVIDHTRGQSTGGDTIVNIYNAPAGTRTEERTDNQGRKFVEVFIADMASGGPMWKSMAATAGLRRQGR